VTGEGFDGEKFSAVQAGLAPMWPSMTMRRRDGDRTLLVISSVSQEIPANYQPLIPAYEERYLAYVIMLANDPHTRVVFVTSQPVLPRLFDYYLGLQPAAHQADLRSQLTQISVGDSTLRPLTRKIIERPRVIERIRASVPDPSRAVVLPFMTTDLEAQLVVELGIPIYGTDPRLARLGTKSGSREVFAAAGVPHARGTTGVRTVGDVAAALVDLLDGPRPPAEALVKHDEGVGGGFNAVVDLRGARPEDLEERVLALAPEDPDTDTEAFLAALEHLGGVVEERLTGARFRSPSVQLRASPEGGLEVLTTHDQVLGGASGQIYFGCRFPADPGYGLLISQHGVTIGEELVRRGVVGRFGIDFVATDDGDGWSVHAVEINLRAGGTTHPYLALHILTEGEYDQGTGVFLADGRAKHYVASDHLEVQHLNRLTPDDVLDVIEEAELRWDDATGVGTVLHMVSGVAVAGRIGVTTIADSHDDADALFKRVETTLAGAARS
jgi:hypothetical protein